MNAHASPLVPAIFNSDASLGAVLAALVPHGGKNLIIAYDDGCLVQTGYHVTEVKAGSFVTLDCGGNPDAWQETVLQVEDIPAENADKVMTVGKFRSILATVDGKIRLNPDARLTIEVSRPNEPMRIYDVAGVVVEDDQVVMRLGARPAICKPRHRAQQIESLACCDTKAVKSPCCA